MSSVFNSASGPLRTLLTWLTAKYIWPFGRTDRPSWHDYWSDAFEDAKSSIDDIEPKYLQEAINLFYFFIHSHPKGKIVDFALSRHSHFPFPKLIRAPYGRYQECPWEIDNEKWNANRKVGNNIKVTMLAPQQNTRKPPKSALERGMNP